MNARASTSNPPPGFTKFSVPTSDPSRSRSFASSPIRTSRDGVPPAKRRRLASTPTSSSFSLSTPRSSSRPEQPTLPDLHDARTASSMRVLSIWSSLAERYNRRIDEDDIVDIRTGEIIKDRGVLSELPKRYNFGDLADKEEDPAINTDPGSEAADNLVEDEEEDDDEDEDDADGTDAFPASEGLVSPQITRLAPLRPATSSSDADDLRRFLKAEEIRRELDGGDDSSEDEFNLLPPRSSPAKRTMTPAKKTPFVERTKPRPLRTPAPDTESEEEFAALDSDLDCVHRGSRVHRTPSPEVPASIPSPPPPSSSPGPSSSFSLPSSPPSSRTPLNPRRGKESFGSPTPKRQPLAFTSRRTIEESLKEIDLEFPPPQPRAPSVFAGRPSSAFIIDLSLSDAETEDERPHPPAKVTANPKPVAPDPRMVRKNGSTPMSKRPTPFVLIGTKPPTTVTPTCIASESPPSPTDPDPVTPSQPRTRRETETSPKKGRPRTRSSKDKPPDLGGSKGSKRGEGRKAKPVEDKSLEEDGDVMAGGSTSSRVDGTPINRGTTKRVKSPSLSPVRSRPSPNAKTKPKGRKSSTRLASSDEEGSFGSEPSPTKRLAPPESSPRLQPQVTTPEPDSKPKSTRKSAAKPKSARSTRFMESGAPTTAKPKSKAPRKPPEEFVDIESDYSPSSPSPSPAPPTRPRLRSALKRKRRVSSGPSSGEERGNPTDDPEQHSSPPDSSRSQACTIATPEVVDVDDHGDDPEAGGSKPRTRSQSHPKAMTKVASAPAVTSPSDVRREDNTPNLIDGSHTHLTSSLPPPAGFPSQAHQPPAYYPQHQDHSTNFNHGPYPNHDYNRHGHGYYPFFQDPNTQALLTQTVTQLAILMNGGRLPERMGQMGSVPGSMPATNGFPDSSGYQSWPPYTPATSTHPHSHDCRYQRPQEPHFTHNQMGGGAGPSTSSPTLFPSSNTFPSSLSEPGLLPIIHETGVEQEMTRKARSRSKSTRRVSFVLDPRSGSGPVDPTNDPGETSKQGAKGSPPTTRSSGQAKEVGRRTRGRPSRKGKSKVDEADQGSELDVGNSGEEGSASVDRGVPPRTRSSVRGRAPGPGRR